MTWTAGAAEQGDEADEAFGGTNPRAESGAQPKVPPHARAGRVGRGHRFAAYPRCSADTGGRPMTRTADGEAGSLGRRMREYNERLQRIVLGSSQADVTSILGTPESVQTEAATSGPTKTFRD